MARLSRLPVCAAIALSAWGCAGHAGRTSDIRSALDAQNPRQALALLNEELDVDSAKQLPKDVAGDNTLLLLDRAMVLQQLDQYQLSSRDLGVADKQIEVLDFSRNAADDLGRYLFSDDTGPYRAPAYEKLLINTMNLVNYLARRDLNGARVEARRLAVMQRFIKERQDPALALMGPGSYLAGFSFEHSNRPDEAMRYYAEALKYADYRSLYPAVVRLAQKSPVRSPEIRRILKLQSADGPPPPPAEPEPEQATEPEPAQPDEEVRESQPLDQPAAPAEQPTPRAPPADGRGEILAIVNFGRVPAKYAKRIPIGLALTYASGAISPHDHSRANALAAQGLVTWVNYPELGKPRGEYDVPGFALDGKWRFIEGALAVDREVKNAWEDARGAVVASAITRMLARVVAGEAVRHASGRGIEGLLLSLGTQAALTAADTPDTRSWSTLPARIAFGRVRVAPGDHQIELWARGTHKRQTVRVPKNGFAVVTLTVLS